MKVSYRFIDIVSLTTATILIINCFIKFSNLYDYREIYEILAIIISQLFLIFYVKKSIEFRNFNLPDK
jgi:asparagine N-glycosylation enzyme membrane subunit Stt3